MESGHHSALWLDLDALFADPQAIAPFVAALAAQLRGHAVDVVCGPLLGGAFLAQLLAQSLTAEFCFTERSAVKAERLYGTRYELPAAFRPRVRGRRVALVDDVMSAGSGADYFAQQNLPLVAVHREDYELWTPAACPMCMACQPLEDATSPAA